MQGRPGETTEELLAEVIGCAFWVACLLLRDACHAVTHLGVAA